MTENTGFTYPPEFDRATNHPTPEAEAAFRRTILLKRVVLFLCIAVVMLCLAVTAITVITVRLQQLNSTDQLEQTRIAAVEAKRTSKRIEDCTTPGRACYDDAQRRTGTAVLSINRVVILAAACSAAVADTSSETDRVRLTTACVVERLAQGEPTNFGPKK